jgi:hypothetical protein
VELRKEEKILRKKTGKKESERNAPAKPVRTTGFAAVLDSYADVHDTARKTATRRKHA